MALLMSAVLYAFFSGSYYIARGNNDVSAPRAMLITIIPNILGVLLVFLVVEWLRNYGLDQTIEKLDNIYGYLDRHVKTLAAEIDVVDRLDDVPWQAIFGSGGPICILSNFATQPLRLGHTALKKAFREERAGHLIVFADPEDSATVSQTAKSRQNLNYANDDASVVTAIRESLAYVVEALPDSVMNSPDSTIPGIEILLAREVVGFTAYWTSEAVSFSGLQCVPENGAPIPRIICHGNSSTTLRAYCEAVTRQIKLNSKAPTLNEVLNLCTPVRSQLWVNRMRTRLCTT
jgi:hypothetical protein